jgi:DNA-binding response OmpR family regulator
MSRIYIVEDNKLIRDGVVEYFELHDYEVVAFDRGEPVLEAIHVSPPDAVILDIMLPDTSGFLVARELRRHSDVPILFLTAKDAESDRVMGFEIGADDYIVKPFSTKELLLRTEAVLRRTEQKDQDEMERGSWRLGEHVLEIDRNLRKVFVDEDEVHLTNAELEILSYLAFREERAISRDQILGECLGYHYSGSERTVDTHIANIRMRLGDSRWIETVRGFGYRFSPASVH